MALNTLFLAISGHGLGHAGQIAPVVGELRRRQPDLRLVIRSAIRRDALEGLFGTDFVLLEGAPEPSIRMHGPLDLDIQGTLEAYTAYHDSFHAHISQEIAHIQASGADVVLTDIAYTPIRAARKLGIPCIALCSLNWADVLAHYMLPAQPRLSALVDEIRSCYAEATRFIAPAPSMRMDGLSNLEYVGPIARRANVDPYIARTKLKSRPGISLVLITMGGVPECCRSKGYPSAKEIHWIVPDDGVSRRRTDVTPASETGLDFIDILAASDVVVTKPGYGTFLEATRHGVPVAYVERPDWPESYYLERWISRNGVAARIERDRYEKFDYLEVIEKLLFAPTRGPCRFLGAQQAARKIFSACCEIYN
ncbi:hypothetical protein NYO91_00260 [Arhodomonas aquaeolei]|uniref:hypothetical protein n=1 Tax=Arhodomonas aquaeolei TaxID=2369 RepID=UPI002166D2AE|nr:hypothetical protein [Arhodomonas aquaeolei]MCS4502499.1 hypothetical protein [Arhodomonas aquaeolei]